jgi:hypothetical protein
VTAPPFLRKLIEPTFERYWHEFVERRDGHKPWDDYTPYELRTVGTFVRLGWRDRRRSSCGTSWPIEGPRPGTSGRRSSGAIARKCAFIGDMPHAWIASDFIRVALDLFAYERAEDQSLVLAGGVPWDWLRGNGVALSGLYTPYGRLSYTLRRQADRVADARRRHDVPTGGSCSAGRAASRPA